MPSPSHLVALLVTLTNLGGDSGGARRELEGKTALITGGVSGIGFGIARAFTAAGMDLMLTYRRRRGSGAAPQNGFGRAAPRAALPSGSTCATGSAGVKSPRKSGRSTYSSTMPASVSSGLPTRELRGLRLDHGREFRRGRERAGHLMPRMKARGAGGHIVNVASMAAYLSGPQAGIYTASKFAVRGLTESLRYNLAPYGIGVSLMCPGLTRTYAWDSRAASDRPIRGLGLRPARAGRTREIRHGIRGRHGSARGRGKDARRHDREPRGDLHASGVRPRISTKSTGLAAALPQETVPEGRQQIERLRRAANAAAAAGKHISLDDLT